MEALKCSQEIDGGNGAVEPGPPESGKPPGEHQEGEMHHVDAVPSKGGDTTFDTGHHVPCRKDVQTPRILPVVEAMRAVGENQSKEARREAPLVSALPIVGLDAPLSTPQQRQFQKNKKNVVALSAKENTISCAGAKQPTLQEVRPTRLNFSEQPLTAPTGVQQVEHRSELRATHAPSEEDVPQPHTPTIHREGEGGRRPLCTLPAVENRKRPSGGSREEHAKENLTPRAFPVPETGAGHVFPLVGSNKQNSAT
uniref:Uncharacterized protein TCIL3000_10_1500 n=1 Tax=Trypanosoma congolense (strain IL3000) TaxID=1068625 RepID=G0UVH6_TRYCI|nr:unnamed protein product [Trypanosoma congolense IL3000]